MSHHTALRSRSSGHAGWFSIALLLLYDVAPVTQLRDAAGGDSCRSQFCLFGLLPGFGVRCRLRLLHGWLSLAYVEAPKPTRSASGILLKMGAYGLIRAAATLPAAASALQ